MAAKMTCVLSLFVIFLVFFNVSGDIRLKQHGPPPLKDFIPRANPNWGTITQRVDNFNPQDNRTWQMRYLFHADFYQPNGPIIIYLGGEWEIGPGRLEAGLVADIGRQHQAFLFYTEHRYYGRSQPLQDWSTKNLEYLSVDQALADIAHFIETVKEEYDLQGSKVVVVGGSYSATMATWMRLKYPHLVDVAWASSAPVVAQVDFPEYQEVVGKNIRLVNETCYKVLENASRQMWELIGSEEGRSKIGQMFNTCTPLRNEFPYNEHFWGMITEVFAGIVQYAYPGDIENRCNEILGSNATDDLGKLGDFVRSYYNGGCLGDYDEFIELISNSEISNGIYRQWYYQVCSEFGFLQTTTSSNQPFGKNTLTPEYYYRVCEDLFGLGFGEKMLNHSIAQTNMKYGGRTEALTQVVSIHGSVDPWHPLGITESLHEDAPAKLVTGTSHCGDFGSVIPSDNSEMKEAKKLIVSSISRWLQ